MAALIGGNTVHSWGVIPTSKTAATAKHANKEVDWDQLFENCISMRWLVIDEISTLSLGLLGPLESFLRTKACTRHPYAFADGSRRRQPRMFGGLNLCLAGDLWQLGPVRDCPMFSHPLRKTDGTRYEALEQRMHGHGPNEEHGPHRRAALHHHLAHVVVAQLLLAPRFPSRDADLHRLHAIPAGLPGV